MSINISDRNFLLEIARNAIADHITQQETGSITGYPGSLNYKQGAFVTIRIMGELRGCIGTMETDQIIPEVIRHLSIQAAFRDWRFPPLSKSELPQLEIEISLLTPARKIDSHKNIILGRDGIIIKKWGHSAVFLPHVATDQGWSLKQTLAHLCIKAGLSSDDWKKEAQFFTFQAQVFSDSDT